MRILTISAFAASVSIGSFVACNRAEPTAAALSTPTTADAARDAGGAPVGTAGPSEAPRPAAREVTIPAGTALPIVLDTPIGSDTSRVEQRVQAHLARPIVVRGVAVLPAGSAVSGVVTHATRSGKVKGRARIGVRFDEIVPRGGDERYTISTRPIGRVAPGTKKKDALEIGAPAAGGALIGAIVGGKKGALIGGAVGGGAGTAVVLSTRGKEVRLRRGAALTLKLAQPLTVRMKG